MKRLRLPALLLSLCLLLCACGSSSKANLFQALQGIGSIRSANTLEKSFSSALIREKDMGYTGGFHRNAYVNAIYKGYKFLMAEVDFDPDTNRILRIRLDADSKLYGEDFEAMLQNGSFTQTSSGYVCSLPNGQGTITVSTYYNLVMLEKVWYYRVDYEYN